MDITNYNPLDWQALWTTGRVEDKEKAYEIYEDYYYSGDVEYAAIGIELWLMLDYLTYAAGETTYNEYAPSWLYSFQYKYSDRPDSIELLKAKYPAVGKPRLELGVPHWDSFGKVEFAESRIRVLQEMWMDKLPPFN